MAATAEAQRAESKTATSQASYARLRPGPGKQAAEVAAHQRARIHSAMVELAARRGYDGVTARELARLSGVSTRAFYEHFCGKEDCFLRTHELVVRRAAQRIAAAQAGGRDWQEGLRRAFGAFVRELELEPAAARFALLEPYGAGPAALDQLQRAERSFAALLADSFSRAHDGVLVPPLAVECIVAGAAHLACTRVAFEDDGDFAVLGDRLAEWAIACRDEAAAEIGGPPGSAEPSSPAGALSASPSSKPEAGARSPDGDRALILAAAAKLAATKGYAQLSIARIRAAAGISRRSFDAHFEGVEDCFLTAVDQRAETAIRRVASTCAAHASPEQGIPRALEGLCMEAASDPILAKACFGELAAAGDGGLRCRGRLVEGLGRAMAVEGPTDQQPLSLAAEASAGAIWSVICRRVRAGRTASLPQMAPMLSRIATASSSEDDPARECQLTVAA